QGQCERPGRLVPDLPVWLDNLVCQLLEKKPEHRPVDAAMVGKVLGTIQEKIEAQQSARVEAAKARLMDRPRGHRDPDEEDREAARVVAGRRKRKRKGKPWYERAWLKAVGLLVVLAIVIGCIVIVLQPPSQEKLYKEAEKLMTSGSEDDVEKAIDGPIKRYMK